MIITKKRLEEKLNQLNKSVDKEKKTFYIRKEGFNYLNMRYIEGDYPCLGGETKKVLHERIKYFIRGMDFQKGDKRNDT